MSDYIKREDAITALEEWAVNLINPKFIVKEDAICALKDIPSADVVEVVRCKDCIHNDQCKHRVVMWVEDPINTWHKDIDFCSYGERKEQEHE